MASTPHRSVDDGHDEKTSMKDGATTFDIDVNNLYESDDDGLDPVYYRPQNNSFEPRNPRDRHGEIPGK